MHQACRAFANSHPKLPELLAKYTHCLMSHDKKSGAHHQLHPPASGTPSTSLLSEETLEKKIENIGIVFCLIDDKDVFKKYYAKFLAKRLIKGASAFCLKALTPLLTWLRCNLHASGTSIANDLETLLIQKLRDICGHDFVSKLQKMLKDKLLSKVSVLLLSIAH